MKRCPVCRREFPESQKFCDQHGVALVVEAVPSQAKLVIHHPDGSKSTVPLAGRAQTIGKSPESDLVISDTAISRKHAVIEPLESTFVIRDLGSLNGVIVNGRRITAEGQRLANGDEITLGRTKLTFQLEQPPVAAEKAMDAPVAIEPTAMPEPPPAQSSAPTLIEGLNFQVARTGELLPLPAGGKVGAADALSAPLLHINERYEIKEKLAQEDSGTLYRARRRMLGDEVAIRVMRPDLVGNEIALERFHRQAMVAARIKHPNSVQVYDFGYSAEGAAYMVEELHSSRTLRDLMREERGLSLIHVVDIFNQLCGAVHAAHLHGIVLRALKPEIIYLEKDPEGREIVKVGGYGLAKVDETISRGKALTGPLGVIGSPPYTAPEQWLGQMLDGRADVYSLGVILFELLTGTLPFNPERPEEMMDYHLQVPAPDITEYGRSDLDESVSNVIQRALAKDPRERTPSALLLAEELQAAAGAREGLLSRTVAKLTGMLPVSPLVVAKREVAPPGESVLPSVVPEVVEKGHGAFNPVVMALMAEAFLSRISSGLIKTAVPLYALLVFGMKITSVMALVLIQNVVPLLLRPFFGTLADRYGKKRVFMISLIIRTLVSVLYAMATLPLLFAISLVRGLADSAKGPSVSGMIADHTDEKHIAQAYSWYTTTKSTSGGIGEALAAFVLVILIGWFAGAHRVQVNMAVLEKNGKNVEEVVKAADPAAAGAEVGGGAKLLRLDRREMSLNEIPIEDLPKVVAPAPLRRALVAIFIFSTILSACSLVLVAIFIEEKKKEKKEKKSKSESKTGLLDAPREQPNVWSFALLGMALTAPAYMVTGEFFIILAVKLEVTARALGWIKIVSETLVPLVFGPFFGWLADRIGAGKVIALRSVANLLTSVFFWIVPSFAGTALLGGMMGLARAIDEIGKAAFKPTWGAISAKISSFNLASRSRTMGILEGGVDASDLAFPVIAGALLQYLSLGPLMFFRGLLAIAAEIYGVILMRKYRI